MAAANSIPEWARDLVHIRSRRRCERCGAPQRMGHLHHRRSRRVRDLHTHCPCVLLLLCPTCHRAVHAEPVSARLNGWIISQWNTAPMLEAVSTPWGLRTHDCRGGVVYLPSVTDQPKETP